MCWRSWSGVDDEADRPPGGEGMSESVNDLESQQNKKAQEVLRFLIKDQAFSVDFLITAIQEYIENNNVERKRR